MKRAWLKPFSWAVIVETNRQLCLPKAALHKPTRDGYDVTRRLWDSRHQTDMTLGEATELYRRCHQLAPFCSFNGNTFVAVIRKVIGSLKLVPDKAEVLRTVAGHVAAGTATPDEQQTFTEMLDELSTPPEA